jgi:hypothetical protein
LIGDTVEAVFEVRGSEVDEKTKVEFGELEIGEDLFGMDGLKTFNGLQFDENLIVHNQVGSK